VEFRRGGVHPRIGSVGRSLRSSLISSSKQPRLQDCLANHWEINDRLRFPMHVYEVRPGKDKRGFDLISDVVPFGRLWYDTPDNAIGYAQRCSRSHDAVIRVYDNAGSAKRAAKHYKNVRLKHLTVLSAFEV